MKFALQGDTHPGDLVSRELKIEALGDVARSAEFESVGSRGERKGLLSPAVDDAVVVLVEVDLGDAGLNLEFEKCRRLLRGGG